MCSWAVAWKSEGKLRSMSGTFSAWKPRKVAKECSVRPVHHRMAVRTGFSGRSNPDSYWLTSPIPDDGISGQT